MTFNGIDAIQRGRFAEAQMLLNSAVEKAPGDQRIHAELAKVHLRNGELPAAIRELQEAVRLSGGDATYHVELGRLYLQTGQLELARQQADLALSNDRRFAAAWSLKGFVEVASGQRELACFSFHRALSHDPELNDARYQLARIYRDAGAPQRALAVIETLMRPFDPVDVPPEYIALQGTALADVGQLDKAAEILASAADRPAPLPEVLLELSRVQVLRGEVANARRTLLRGRELFADRPEFARQLELLPPNEGTAQAAR
jgi:tetratricopeptide (TPR) repeat protein